MPQITATTTSHPVTVVGSIVSSSTTTLTVVLTSVGLTAAVSQHDMVLPPPMIPRDTMRSVVGQTIVLQQQPQSWMPFEACTNYTMGPP